MAITNPSAPPPRPPRAGGAGSTDTTGGRAQLAARLGVGEAALTAQVGTDPSGVDLDALVAAAPLWLLEARAEEALRQAAFAVLRDSTDTGHEEAAGPAPARRAVAGALGDDEVAELLGLPVDAVHAFAPRRGWTADDVAALVRNPPAWAESPEAARRAGREQTRKGDARDYRRQAAAAAKERLKDRSRARWAAILEVDESVIPLDWTKQPTPSAVKSFRARPPRWAREIL